MYLCKPHSFLLITRTMQRQIKASFSPFKLNISIIFLVFTAHIPLTSLARSWHFSTFSSSLALSPPSSGVVTIMLWQLFSFCRCSLSLLASFPWSVHTVRSHNSLYLHFQAHFLEHGHNNSHFAQTHIFLSDPNERPNCIVMSPFVLFLFPSVLHTS